MRASARRFASDTGPAPASKDDPSSATTIAGRAPSTTSWSRATTRLASRSSTEPAGRSGESALRTVARCVSASFGAPRHAPGVPPRSRARRRRRRACAGSPPRRGSEVGARACEDLTSADDVAGRRRNRAFDAGEQDAAVHVTEARIDGRRLAKRPPSGFEIPSSSSAAARKACAKPSKRRSRARDGARALAVVASREREVAEIVSTRPR